MLDDDGFTLAEVMVVLFVIGVLAAVGTPTFLGARDRTEDISTQTSLNAALVAASVVYIDELDFVSADPAGMAADEPSLSYVAGLNESTDAEQISVATTSDNALWGAAARSDSGTCYYVRTNGRGETSYGSSNVLSCTGQIALTTQGNNWSTPGGVGLSGLEGGFQSDTSVGGYWNSHGAGQLVGDQWEVVSGTVDARIEHSSSFNYTVDGQFMDLNGGSAGHIRRSVTLIPDTAYNLTFHLGENVWGGPAVKQMEVIWNGTVLVTMDVDYPAHTLELITIPIPAQASPDATIEFRSVLSGAYGPVLGNVLLTPVAG
ncbi:MAG: prepilin-type N-terminal cleavage/methylation domain-containing protein [Actinomycetota bacterium]